MSAQPPNPLSYATPGYPPPQPKRGRSLFGWVLFIGLAVMLFLVLQTGKRTATDVAISDVFVQLNANNVSEIVIDGNAVRAQLKRPVNYGSPPVTANHVRAELPPGTAQSWPFIETLLSHHTGPSVRVENNQGVLLNVLVPLIPWGLIFLFLWYFVFRQLRNRPATPIATPVYMVPPPEQK